MKRFRLFLATLVLIFSTAAFANSNSEGDTEKRRGTVRHQIEQMLSDSGLIIEEDFTVTVIFKIDEERRIEIRLIDSLNEEVNIFLRKRLENQKLYGNSWDDERIYELPVKVQATR